MLLAVISQLLKTPTKQNSSNKLHLGEFEIDLICKIHLEIEIKILLSVCNSSLLRKCDQHLSEVYVFMFIFLYNTKTLIMKCFLAVVKS